MNDEDRFRLLPSMSLLLFVGRGGTEGITIFPSKWIWNPKTPENV
jgi:hypothetical protein